MTDRKTVLFPLLLFGIFFVLIAITGSFQIVITKGNIEELLRGEGEIVAKSTQRQIDINIEYLDFFDRSPSVITPGFLNVMPYDEAIVEDIYALVIQTPVEQTAKLPFDNLELVDLTGRQIFTKGVMRDTAKRLAELLSKNQQTLIRMPSREDASLFIGIRMDRAVLFLSLTEKELENVRKKYIVKAILENETKGLNIVGINVYEPSGRLYAGLTESVNNILTLTRPLGSRYFPGYTLQILVSKQLASDVLRRTSFSFVLLLLFLLLGGAAGIHVIFLLERRHADRLTEMEKEMELKERLVSLGKLASGMAHEIRNPLNAMSMSIQRLKREFVPATEKKEDYYRFCDIVRSELLRVNQIVEEFLLSTKTKAPMEGVRIHLILDEVATILGEKARSKGIEITNRADPSCTFVCQKERIKQAFHNLLLNSIEAMEGHGSIQLWTDIENQTLRVHLKDTGPGLKKQDMLKIFEYYYTTKDKGMGLGLPISYMIMKDHGGDIQVISEEGRGAHFVVSLPLKQQEGDKKDG
jgi:signal transduction histidine kinase